MAKARSEQAIRALWTRKWACEERLTAPGLDPWEREEIRIQLARTLEALESTALGGPRMRRRGQQDHTE